jgi:class 3 adenylate cyclase/tetratricopeptide (TPR) repeat protein
VSRQDGPSPEGLGLTFLFTDVEGSTRLLQELGDEQYGTVIATHDRLLRETFTRRGGLETNTQGDAFFFVFDDARLAALAAVEAQRALAAERWPGGSQLKIRIGLHTGKASLLAGKFVGLAVHRAARIADAAHGGQVLVSEATARIIAEEAPFRLRDLGEHRLKDLERPLRLFQLVADELGMDFPPVRALSPGSPLAITGGPAGAFGFAGRARELGIVQRALDDVLSGAGRVVLVQGEAGIGKSRLAWELGHLAAERGVAMVSGRCVEGGAAPTLWPWLEIMRALSDRSKADASEELSPLVAGLLAPATAAAPGLAASAEARFALYTAVAERLTAAASQRPLLVVLDDIHWADTPSLELLETVALDLVAVRLLLVAAYREDEPNPAKALTRVLNAVVRCPWTQRVVLRGLAEDAVGQLIRDAMQEEPPPALVAAVHSRTRGNPFFVAELVRLAAAEPSLGLDALATGIPLGVSDVVRWRLQALARDTRELLELAAIIGDAFDFRLLAQASGGDGDACVERLEPALAIRTVVETEEDAFRFSHGIVRETIVQDLTPLRRARLHARVVDALVADDGTAGDVAEIVADHLWHARQLVDPARAVRALERAAEVALSRHAYDTAGRRLEQALTLTHGLERDRDDVELRLELALATLGMMTHGYSAPAVLAGFERTAAIARRSGNLRELVRSLHGTASGLAVSGRFRDSLQVARACLDAATELGDPLALALGHHVVGIAHLHLGDIADARRECEACVEAYEQSRLAPAEPFDVAVPAHLAGLVFAAIAEYLGGDKDAATRARDRSIAIAGELGTPFAWQVAMFFSGWLAALEDDPRACRSYIERGQEHSVGEHVFPVFAALSPTFLAWAAGRLGDEQAVERLDAIVRQLDTIGVSAFSHFFQSLRADLVAAQGGPEAGLAAFEHAIAITATTEERFYLAELRRRRGELLLRLGRDDEGRAELRGALMLAREQGAGGLDRRVRETLAAYTVGSMLDDAHGALSVIHPTEEKTS